MAVEALPRHTKEAMLRGIETNRIIVGAYVDSESGGICPMLAAHRNGGRTSVASFARAWDAYTDAKRPRRATRREVRTLRSLLEWSLGTSSELPSGSIAEAAAQIRAEREQFRCAAMPTPGRTAGRPGEDQGHPSRKDVLAAAEEQLSEQHGARALGSASPLTDPASAAPTRPSAARNRPGAGTRSPAPGTPSTSAAGTGPTPRCPRA